MCMYCMYAVSKQKLFFFTLRFFPVSLFYFPFQMRVAGCTSLFTVIIYISPLFMYGLLDIVQTHAFTDRDYLYIPVLSSEHTELMSILNLAMANRLLDV